MKEEAPSSEVGVGRFLVEDGHVQRSFLRGP